MTPSTVHAERRGRGSTPEAPSRPGGLVLLLCVVGLRSVAHMGSSRSCPCTRSPAATAAPTGSGCFRFSCSLGRSGRSPAAAADRFGRGTVLRASFAISTPLILVYALDEGLLGVIALIVSGATVIGTFGVCLVMSQEYMPARVGLASGLSIGMAIGLGGVAALSLGAIADAIDLEAAVVATAFGPAIAFLVPLVLPPAPRVVAVPAPRPPV